MGKLFLLSVVVILNATCSQPGWERIETGVVINLNLEKAETTR